MKKKLLVCAALFFTGSASVSAQLSKLENKIKKVPPHVEERLSGYNLIIPSNALIKNASYDTPMTIERYAVDALEVQTLDRVYQLTYLPGGQLRTQTQMDGVLNNQYRSIFNYDGVGEISSIIYQNWNGVNWVFYYREKFTYTPQGHLASVVYEQYNMGDWEFDGVTLYTYENSGSNITALIISQSYDWETWEDNYRFDYAYNGGNSPSEITISWWDEDLLSFLPFQKWVISNWGPKPFKPDFFFNSRQLDYKVTDYSIYKLSEIDMMYPADFVYYDDYNFLDGSYDTQLNVYSTYAGNNRTEFIVEEWNGTIYEPVDRYVQQFDECYGYRGYLSYEYIVPTGWQLDGGVSFVGETTPYNESCYVTAYNYYTNFSAVNPTGNWTRRWVINQFSNLSLNEKELNNALHVFPNPANDEVTVNFTGDFTSNFKLSVIGLDGKIHYATSMSSSVLQVNLSQLLAGMYTLVLENNNTVLTEKIVKR